MMHNLYTDFMILSYLITVIILITANCIILNKKPLKKDKYISYQFYYEQTKKLKYKKLLIAIIEISILLIIYSSIAKIFTIKFLIIPCAFALITFALWYVKNKMNINKYIFDVIIMLSIILFITIFMFLIKDSPDIFIELFTLIFVVYAIPFVILAYIGTFGEIFTKNGKTLYYMETNMNSDNLNNVIMKILDELGYVQNNGHYEITKKGVLISEKDNIRATFTYSINFRVVQNILYIEASRIDDGSYEYSIETNSPSNRIIKNHIKKIYEEIS